MTCSLHGYITQRGTLSEEEAARILKMIANGLQFIHSKGFIHFDLKPGNFLLNLDSFGKIKTLKVADFGLTTHIGSKRLQAGRDTQGTLAYMAPEMLTANCNFDNRIEAWSLGMILCKLLTNKLPFHDKDDRETIKNIVLKELDFYDDDDEGIWDTVSIEAQDLI